MSPQEVALDADRFIMGFTRAHRLLVLCTLTAVAATTACSRSTELGDPVASSTTPAAQHVSPPDTADSLLFVVRAASGSITPVPKDSGAPTTSSTAASSSAEEPADAPPASASGGGTSAPIVELRLNDFEAVTWFSDRPERDAGITEIREALKSFEWRDNGDAISTDPPNATLTAAGLNSTVVLELLSATVDDAGSKAPSFSLEARVVGGDTTANGDFGAAELFIDSTVPQAGSYPGSTTSPVESMTPISERVSVLTIVSGLPDSQEAKVTLQIDGRDVAGYTLNSASAETTGNASLDGVDVRIDNLRFVPATANTAGMVTMSALVDDGGNPTPVTGLAIASWSLTG